ncbi:MAG: glutamate-cysteine ligase family protein [Myxococcota bacterium]
MGEHRVEEEADEPHLRLFMRRVLEDLQALERMIDAGMIESGVRRIGAEQEMFLVDSASGPAPIATEVLDRLGDGMFTTELARFNLEANLKPFHLGGKCLSRLERQIRKVVDMARAAAEPSGGDVLLTGILPSVRLEDLSMDNMTPNPRYRALNSAMRRLRGGSFQTIIKGLDELHVTHDNILLEACNTSFQIHFQAGAREFPRLYNLAQAVTAPVLAAAANSPVLLQHRLWHETRIALFQQSVDVRSSAHQKRGARSRVSFGERWIEESVLEIFREDLSRLRVMLAAGDDEDSLARVERGEVPPLSALRLYNGTVYRWNRPCYGVHNGKPHLRIENRALPAGPTPGDEVANAAFYFGLMSTLLTEYGPIEEALSFDAAKANFLAAAHHGLHAQLTWVGGEHVQATDLILEELLPLARKGLQSKRVDPDDVDHYLGIVEARVRGRQTGAEWAFRSLAAMEEQGVRREARHRALVAHTREAQHDGEPVHTWPLARVDQSEPMWHAYVTVGQLMSTDVFTVRPQDLVDLAASMMQWEHIRHVPVEDDGGALVGIITHRHLLRLVGRGSEPVAIEDIMERDVVTCSPRTQTVEALRTMKDEGVSCLPVVEDDGRLVGIVTEMDFLDVARHVLEDELARAGEEADRS